MPIVGRSSPLERQSCIGSFLIDATFYTLDCEEKGYERRIIFYPISNDKISPVSPEQIKPIGRLKVLRLLGSAGNANGCAENEIWEKGYPSDTTL